MSVDQRIVSERVQYAGQAYRIRSEAKPEPAEIPTPSTARWPAKTDGCASVCWPATSTRG